jgi:polyhydroxybutyrate depolymerase
MRQRARSEDIARLRSAACLLVALGCATAPKEPSDPAEPASTTERAALAPAVLGPDGVCSAALAPGTSERRIESSGVERRFLVHVPERAAAGSLPLVLELHGSGGSPERQMELSQLALLAERRGFLLVAAEAIDRRWNVPPETTRASDVQFVSDLLDAVAREACIDHSRFFATGFSGGGRMVSQLACDLAPRVAAIAAVGGIRFPEPCASARRVPILAFHGTADDVNPYAGGGQPYWGTGVDAAVDGWASHNGCTSRNEETVAPVTRIRHGGSGCTDVVLYRIDAFAHTWPSAVSFAPAWSGSPADGSASATANDLLWSFFEQHPLSNP